MVAPSDRRTGTARGAGYGASLAPAREVEPHEQHVGRPAIRQDAERLEPPGLFDGALRFQIKREVAGAPNELQVGLRSIAVHEEGDLRLERGAVRWPLPAPQDLRHDILQILRERELDPFRAHGRHVASGGRPLAWQRLPLGRGAWGGLPLPRVCHRRRRRFRHRAARRRLARRCRRFPRGPFPPPPPRGPSPPPPPLPPPPPPPPGRGPRPPPAPPPPPPQAQTAPPLPP